MESVDADTPQVSDLPSICYLAHKIMFSTIKQSILFCSTQHIIIMLVLLQILYKHITNHFSNTDGWCNCCWFACWINCWSYVVDTRLILSCMVLIDSWDWYSVRSITTISSIVVMKPSYVLQSSILIQIHKKNHYYKNCISNCNKASKF